MAKKKKKTSKSRSRNQKVTFVAKWYTLRSRPSKSEKVYINRHDLRTLITTQLGGKFASIFSLHTADQEYYCTPLRDAREIIRASKVDRKTWTADKFDCDDFAHVLKGNFAEAAYKDGQRRKAHCFGIVWGSLPTPHAINWMVNDDMRLRFIEPQTDRVFFPRATDHDIHFMLT